MNKVSIRDLCNHADEDVRLEGWLSGLRKGGKIAFLEVRDGTGVCQCVVESNAEAAFAAVAQLTLESSVRVGGRVRADERSQGGFELAVEDLEIVHVAGDYPIARKAHGIDFLMEHRHLWLRSRRPWAILRIRHTLVKACRDFFDEREFTLIDTPILAPAAGEDEQTLFPVDYFGQKAFLAQTGQLYLEAACMALGKVYCFGPTFRAEKSKTRRHLTEFWMLEPEIAFADLDEVMAVAEDLVCYLLERVLDGHEADLAFLGRDVDRLKAVQRPFPRLTYSEAVDYLRSPEMARALDEEGREDEARLGELRAEASRLEREREQVTKPWKRERIEARLRELGEAIRDLERDVENRPRHARLARTFEWGKDLGGSDETLLSRRFDRPVFVTDYPLEAKAFYMKRSAADPRTVRNMDLLAPEGYGEIVGGSQREEDLDVLLSQMRAKNVAPENYPWYLDLRRYGTVPHGGFGMGLERVLAWICGLKHVRETIPFPRTLGRMSP